MKAQPPMALPAGLPHVGHGSSWTTSVIGMRFVKLDLHVRQTYS